MCSVFWIGILHAVMHLHARFAQARMNAVAYRHGWPLVRQAAHFARLLSTAGEWVHSLRTCCIDVCHWRNERMRDEYGKCIFFTFLLFFRCLGELWKTSESRNIKGVLSRVRPMCQVSKWCQVPRQMYFRRWHETKTRPVYQSWNCIDFRIWKKTKSVASAWVPFTWDPIEVPSPKNFAAVSTKQCRPTCRLLLGGWFLYNYQYTLLIMYYAYIYIYIYMHIM